MIGRLPCTARQPRRRGGSALIFSRETRVHDVADRFDAAVRVGAQDAAVEIPGELHLNGSVSKRFAGFPSHHADFVMAVSVPVMIRWSPSSAVPNDATCMAGPQDTLVVEPATVPDTGTSSSTTATRTPRATSAQLTFLAMVM